jgi:hypothetical protein
MTHFRGHSRIRPSVTSERIFRWGNDLGENHHKLAIPAEYLRRHESVSLFCGSTPLTRALLQEPSKRFIQGRLIREAATKRNVGEWQV